MMINADVDEARKLLCGPLNGEAPNRRSDSLCALVPAEGSINNLGIATAKRSSTDIGAYGDERTGSQPDPR
jgi:hypothetical protein